ncbi:hypothetical protein WJX79_001104 [Trebouxia sp. C0005]
MAAPAGLQELAHPQVCHVVCRAAESPMLARLYKQFAFSINAAGGQNALLSMLCLSGNPVDEGAHSDVLEICV